MVKDFYGMQGFVKIRESEDGSAEWELDLSAPYFSKNVAIKVN